MNFVQRRLPWIAGAGLLVVYLLTLNRWITFSGLPVMAKILGWDWQPMVLTPLLYALTYPVRWFPAGAQLVVLNLFSVLCSALALVLLARSVAILPHDRTREQRGLERSEYSFLSIRTAWVAPALAVLVCGLQLSFWENSVVATGESLDLLLFAYCLRCLLEYRVEYRDQWLYRMAVVYGLSITNNYAMIAFLPLFAIALLWIKGRAFFDVRELLKLLGLGLLGLSLYLLVPAIASAGHATDSSFFELLRTHWGSQRKTLWEFPRFLLIIMSFTSLLPILFIGIRWPAQYGDISAAGNALANLMMHVVHGVFLVACVWVMFDPTFSPRALGQRYGQPWAFLPLYYLAALTVGYCSGYFLLIMGSAPLKAWQRPSPLVKLLRQALVALVWILLVAAPAALVWVNLPKLRADHAPYLQQYGVAAARYLPEDGAVVLSDDPYRLYAVEAALRRAGVTSRYTLVNSTALPRPAYHRFLHRRNPQVWPETPPDTVGLTRQIASRTLIELLQELRAKHEVYYLHPSFGYYFEFFNLKPRNLVYALEVPPTNQITAPRLTAAEAAANDQFWQDYRQQLAPLAAFQQRAAMAPKRNLSYTTALVGGFYSRALNYLGVELQRAGQAEKAAEYFAAALEFNTNNPAAFINLTYNQQMRAGRRGTIMPNEMVDERLQRYRGNIELVLNYNGPIDEPQFCFMMSHVFANGGNFRQAVQQLQRAVELQPAFYEARIALASVYSKIRRPDQALQEIAHTRALPALRTTIATNPVPLIQVEALAYAVKKETSKALELLHGAQHDYPAASGPYKTEAEIYLAQNDLTNALRVFARQIEAQKKNPQPLIDYGFVQLRAKAYKEAIPYFTRALELSPENSVALMNRARAYLNLNQLEAAKQDYQTLLAILPQPPHWVFYGLGEVFFKMKDAPHAIQNYEKYLKLAPPELQGRKEMKEIEERIEKLKSGSF